MVNKKYPALNLRLSQDLKENLDLLAECFGIKDTEGAYPKIVRMAVRSLKVRFLSLQEEYGKDWLEIFQWKLGAKMKEGSKF